jgi:hypothetical protein
MKVTHYLCQTPQVFYPGILGLSVQPIPKKRLKPVVIKHLLLSVHFSVYVLFTYVFYHTWFCRGTKLQEQPLYTTLWKELLAFLKQCKLLFFFHCAFWFIKFYSHQLMHFLIQLCTSLLSDIKITLKHFRKHSNMFRSSKRSYSVSSLFISLSMLLILKIIKIFKKYYKFIVVVAAYV